MSSCATQLGIEHCHEIWTCLWWLPQHHLCTGTANGSTDWWDPLRRKESRGPHAHTHTLQPIHSLFALPLANVSANTSTGPTSLTYHLPIRLLAGLTNARGIKIHTPNIYALNLTVLLNDTAPHIESRPHTLTPGDLTMIKLISLIEQAQSRPHAVHKPWRVFRVEIWSNLSTIQSDSTINSLIYLLIYLAHFGLSLEYWIMFYKKILLHI